MAIFMNFGGIAGGVSPPASHGWLEFLSFDFDAAVTRARMSSSSSVSRTVDTAIATKLADRTSAWLMQLHVAGRRLPSCLVKFTRAGAPNSVAAVGFTLHRVYVERLRTIRYSPMPKRVDELVLGFERITLGHYSAKNLSSMEAEALSKMWKASVAN